MENTMSVWKWFWGWEDYKEEAWLRDMANSGWHLKRVQAPRYTFVRGEPKDVAYRLDFISSSIQSRDDYYALFQDAGWEHIGTYAGWQYFRKPAENGVAPEIFTDNSSKVEKYRRLLLFLVIILGSLLPSYILLLDDITGRGIAILQGFMMLMILFYLFAMFKIWQRMAQLKRL